MCACAIDKNDGSFLINEVQCDSPYYMYLSTVLIAAELFVTFGSRHWSFLQKVHSMMTGYLSLLYACTAIINSSKLICLVPQMLRL